MLISLFISSSTLCLGGSVLTVEIISISSTMEVEEDEEDGGADGAESGCDGADGAGADGAAANGMDGGAISSFNLRSHTNASLPSYFSRRPLE